jgi:hypothetical protein
MQHDGNYCGEGEQEGQEQQGAAAPIGRAMGNRHGEAPIDLSVLRLVRER